MLEAIAANRLRVWVILSGDWTKGESPGGVGVADTVGGGGRRRHRTGAALKARGFLADRRKRVIRAAPARRTQQVGQRLTASLPKTALSWVPGQCLRPPAPGVGADAEPSSRRFASVRAE